MIPYRISSFCQLWTVLNRLYFREIPGGVRLETALAKMRKPLIPDEVYRSSKKLNLGSGSNPLKGYVNVDILPERNPDIISLVDKLDFASDREWDLVRASHILEHFEYDDGCKVLAEWRRVLKPGGYIVVCVPDYIRLCWLAIIRPGLYDPLHPKFGDESRVFLGALYALDLPHEFRHKVIFTPESLKRMLSLNGFEVVGRQTHQVEEPYTLGVMDDSCTIFSINMVARRKD